MHHHSQYFHTANAILMRMMDDRRWNSTQFYEETLLPAAYYFRLKKGHVFELRIYVAIGLALHLCMLEMNQILATTGRSLSVFVEEHYAYAHILEHYPGDVAGANAYLLSKGFKPLIRST